jgi:V/A-type H+-transporting ATPase subunit I
MPWRSELLPAPMLRTAIVAPDSRARRVLVETADMGLFEPDPAPAIRTGPISSIAERAATGSVECTAELSVDPVDPTELATSGDVALLLGEASLEHRTASAIHTGSCTVLPGWITGNDVNPLRDAIAPHGGAIVELARPRGMLPPTAHADRSAGTALRPLVSTYATVPYNDIDPTWFAAISYMVMFGMMFGDVAHGLAIVALGIVAHRATGARWRAIRPAAPFLIGAGLAAMGFGVLYGEAFGPTGLVPTVWMRPLDEPERLLLVGLAIGGVLLAVTFVLATINRWREDGPAVALYDASGIGGALLLLGAAALVIGLASGITWMWRVGAAIGGVGAILTFTGLLVRAGPGAAGLAQAIVEMFDTVLRLGSNVVSFTRLAAFGLTHAVITEVVWDGTVGLWNRSTMVASVAAVALFSLGNLAAFALGALVGAIQALRLEYYEMFSHLFTSQGRAFDPWHIPARRLETP